MVRFFPKIRGSTRLPGSSWPACRGFKGDVLGKKRQTLPCSGLLSVCLTHLLSCLRNNGNDCVCVLRAVLGELAQPLSLTVPPPPPRVDLGALYAQGAPIRVVSQRTDRSLRATQQGPPQNAPPSSPVPLSDVFHSGCSLLPDPFLASCYHLVLSTDVSYSGRPSQTSCPQVPCSLTLFSFLPCPYHHLDYHFSSCRLSSRAEAGFCGSRDLSPQFLLRATVSTGPSAGSQSLSVEWAGCLL